MAFITIFIIVLLGISLGTALYNLELNQREFEKLKEQKELGTEAFKIYMEETQKEIQALDNLLNDAKSNGYMTDIDISWERRNARIKSEKTYKIYAELCTSSGMLTEYALNQLKDSVNAMYKRW